MTEKNTKSTYMVRMKAVPSIEEHPIVLTLNLTEEQKELVKKITGNSINKLELTAIELNMVVDAAAFEHGGTVGASY